MTRRYEFEGVALEIPLRYDERSNMYLEEYPDFIQHPVYTPEGCPVLFAGEDACPYAEAQEGTECPDCGSCRFYRRVPHTWIGVCGHKKKSKAMEGICGNKDAAGPDKAAQPGEKGENT